MPVSGHIKKQGEIITEKSCYEKRAMNLLVSLGALASVILLMVDYTATITIDNDIIGDPDIECLDEQIRIFVKTRKIFNGRIYAKGKADNPACSKDDFAKQRTKKPYMVLKFGTCGMKSLRSVDPRGMYYGITVVVSFHTMFITKVDQAFHVKCFFEEASRGLAAELGVSMIATTEVEARHAIPGCTYSIHASSIDDVDAGKPAGPVIKYARVGDRVLHQWQCDDPMFGILINNCYVTDGFGKRAEVVDSKGCSVDPILITGIRYSADLQHAYAESMVFKFADRPGVWFFCQIQMCMKKTRMCEGVTPPSCATQVRKPEIGYITEEKRRKALERTRIPGRVMTVPPPTKTTTKKVPKAGMEYELEITEIPTEEYLEERASTVPAYIVSMAETEETLSSYAATPSGYEATTMAYSPKPGFPKVKPTTSTAPTGKAAVVTTIFETEEYYGGKKSPEKLPAKPIGKVEYPEYEDITIPSNLNDLLANLPDDVSADSLQKMFRDSVEDRRALMQGLDYLMNQMKGEESGTHEKTTEKVPVLKEKLKPGDKIRTIQVSWDSHRLADSPLIETNDSSDIAHENKNSSNRHSRKVIPPQIVSAVDTAPTIAGQLIIYDLDEELPTASQLQREKVMLTGSCAISRQGLFIIASSLGGLSAALFIATLLMYLRLVKYSNFYKESSLTSSEPENIPPCMKKVAEDVTLRQRPPFRSTIHQQRLMTLVRQHA